jgi:hypothetical protein
MSRATSAVDMCARIGPPRRAHAPASARSAARCTFSSPGVTGKANGGNTDTAWSKVSKQRNGVLRMIPRGSKPTMSKRPRSSSGRNWATPRTTSTPEPPGPPGLMNSDPIRRWGEPAGSRISDRKIFAPAGRS